MYAERELDTTPYRPQLNPDFVRRVHQQRRIERSESERLAKELSEAQTRVQQLMLEVRVLRSSASKEAQHVSRIVAARSKVSHTYADIEARAIKVFGINRETIRGEGRGVADVFARHFIAYWALRLTRLSSPQIGRLMGGRDHTTILHGAKSYPLKRTRMGRSLRDVR